MKNSNLLYYNDLVLNSSYLVGIDEAGRGALAGPVVVAAVALSYDEVLPGMNDSKKLSPKRRELLYEMIIENALDYAIVCLDHEYIDKHNILKSSLDGMALAAQKIKLENPLILIDGPYLPSGLDARAVVKGDAKHACIAAASILAKVYRDRLMIQQSCLYPQYGFQKNKGYGSAEHLRALGMYGPCCIHRNSYAPVRQSSIWEKLKST